MYMAVLHNSCNYQCTLIIYLVFTKYTNIAQLICIYLLNDSPKNEYSGKESKLVKRKEILTSKY